VSISRIYQPVPLQPQARLRLDEKASHHLARVLRATTGDTLTLFNGEGGEYEAVITHIDKKGVDVEIRSFNTRDAESPVEIILAQGIARGEKMDFIVQKAVELGVTTIIPLITERCNVRLEGEREEKRLQHWQSVISSACEQSGRNRLPAITAPLAFKEWLPQVQADLRFVLSPHVDKKLSEAMSSPASILLLIGPEGGLSDQEVAMAIGQQFLPLNLGPRVLRTETATIAVLSVMQLRFGDFR
jgi:16S rRNA (uracil1498-N3)-methyltransferase